LIKFDSFHIRPADEQACVVSFPPIVAPTKVALFALFGKEKMENYVRYLDEEVITRYTKHVDFSGVSIGRF
jgi:glycyl-tRNA synthetase (class II)